MLEPHEHARAAEINARMAFTLADIPLLVKAFTEGGHIEPHAAMELPEWFVHGLEPESPAYRAQQLQLWQAMSGRDRLYAPEVDEVSKIPPRDPIREPGYFSNKAPNAVQHAAQHMLASALILHHSNLKPGQRALEYGAGFGLTALALSRLGVKVDTVDISAEFCGYVKDAANFYKTDLTPHVGLFGDNPRGEKYDLIFFFEAFHHSLEFRDVVQKIASHLAPGGRIILCGEPVGPQNRIVPYPWGMRLDYESVAMIRLGGWLELGFDDGYLLGVFRRNGLQGTYYPCPQTGLGNLFVFERV